MVTREITDSTSAEGSLEKEVAESEIATTSSNAHLYTYTHIDKIDTHIDTQCRFWATAFARVTIPDPAILNDFT